MQDLERTSTTPVDHAETWAIFRRQASHLSHLVDDLLDVARVTQGKIELRPELIRADQLVELAAASVRNVFQARDHSLSIAIPPVPITVEADPMRMEQVLVNLLNNAARYTEPGGRVSISVRREQGEAVLLVEDNGIGMSAEVRSRVFELFAQGDRSLGRAEGGLGIGLTLVRSLVELHGGRVEAFSEGPGLGSRFVVHLPARDQVATDQNTSPTEPEPIAEADTLPRAVPSRLLLVDDNQDMVHPLQDAQARRISGRGRP